MPIRADMDSLRSMVGAKSTTDENVLSWSLDAATAWIKDRVRSNSINHSDVQHATLLLAARLYKRRLSPEGVAGWDDLGVIRVLSRDPDVERLIEQHVDAYKVWGVA